MIDIAIRLGFVKKTVGVWSPNPKQNGIDTPKHYDKILQPIK